MKWLLFLILIGLGLFSYNQSQTIDTLTANLKKSEETVADLTRQVQVNAQARAASSGAPAYYPPLSTPRPSWMNTTSDLDRTPVSTRRR
jgi:hypothetical protein